MFLKGNRQESHEFGATIRELSEPTNRLKASDHEMIARESTAPIEEHIYNTFKPSKGHSDNYLPYESYSGRRRSDLKDA